MDVPLLLLALLVLGIGLLGLYEAARLTPERQERYRNIRGWRRAVGFLGDFGLSQLVYRLPLPIARGVFIVLGVGICGLAIAGLVTSVTGQ